jgi:hypothetical protein
MGDVDRTDDVDLQNTAPVSRLQAPEWETNLPEPTATAKAT